MPRALEATKQVAGPVGVAYTRVMADSPPDRIERVRRRGRRAGVVLFAVLVGGFTAVCATEIILQVWAPPATAATVGCREGMRGLIHAVRRARQAAAQETGGERAMLDQFRRALEPEWAERTNIGQSCKGDAQATKALAVIDELRYAEESAVRYESADLARRRRQVKALEREMFGATPAPPASVETPPTSH